MNCDKMRMIHANLASPSRKRWFQFSLGSLLILVTLWAILFSWLGPQIRQIPEEKRLAERIEQLGGRINWGGAGQGRGKNRLWYIGSLDLSGTNVNDDDLAEIALLPELTHLCLNNTRISAKGSAHLRRATGLKQLELSGTAITDEELQQFQSISGLEVLKLDGCAITDDGLRHLAGFVELWMLNLDRTAITDNGLIHLAQLAKLRSLSVRGTRVTDEGLQYLHGHTQLEIAYVDGEAGIKTFSPGKLVHPARP